MGTPTRAASPSRSNVSPSPAAGAGVLVARLDHRRRQPLVGRVELAREEAADHGQGEPPPLQLLDAGDALEVVLVVPGQAPVPAGGGQEALLLVVADGVDRHVGLERQLLHPHPHSDHSRSDRSRGQAREEWAAMDRWADACAALSAADPAMAAAIAGLGPCRLVRGRAAGGAFGALARSICFQQLAGAAASAIHGRFAALYDGRPTPAAVAATPDDVLRGGRACRRPRWRRSRTWRPRPSTAPSASRAGAGWTTTRSSTGWCTVRGIGPWTAQMFLIFQLNRPDVWPTGDLGVRVGYGRMHGLDVPPDARPSWPPRARSTAPTARSRPGTAGASSTARSPERSPPDGCRRRRRAAHRLPAGGRRAARRPPPRRRVRRPGVAAGDGGPGRRVHRRGVGRPRLRAVRRPARDVHAWPTTPTARPGSSPPSASTGPTWSATRSAAAWPSSSSTATRRCPGRWCWSGPTRDGRGRCRPTWSTPGSVVPRPGGPVRAPVLPRPVLRRHAARGRRGAHRHHGRRPPRPQQDHDPGLRRGRPPPRPPRHRRPDAPALRRGRRPLAPVRGRAPPRRASPARSSSSSPASATSSTSSRPRPSSAPSAPSSDSVR